MMLISLIESFSASNAQELADQQAILAYISQVGSNALNRESCPLAHITSSAFIFNQHRSKALMVHHNIRATWAWTGGHADGNSNLLDVAIAEAKEETGVAVIEPCTRAIASLDILPVSAHWRKGIYVPNHLHLSVSYLLTCHDGQPLTIKQDENSGVAWFPLEDFTTTHFTQEDTYLYCKLIQKGLALYP